MLLCFLDTVNTVSQRVYFFLKFTKMSSQNSAICTHDRDSCSSIDSQVYRNYGLILYRSITKSNSFLKWEIQKPFMSTFLKRRSTFLSSYTPSFNIIHVSFPELYRDPIPGITDKDFNTCFICTDLFVHISPVHAWISKSSSWKRRFISTHFYVCFFPVFKITLIGRYFSNCFVYRSTS